MKPKNVKLGSVFLNLMGYWMVLAGAKSAKIASWCCDFRCYRRAIKGNWIKIHYSKYEKQGFKECLWMPLNPDTFSLARKVNAVIVQIEIYDRPSAWKFLNTQGYRQYGWENYMP